MNFKHVHDNAGFTKVELALLYGVSRQTIHTWACGGSPRQASYTARMAMVITKALVAAMGKGLLPLGAMAKEQRAARVASMAKTLQNLKPAPI